MKSLMVYGSPHGKTSATFRLGSSKVTIHVLSPLQIIDNSVWFKKNNNHS
jgi:hypothetical protein